MASAKPSPSDAAAAKPSAAAAASAPAASGLTKLNASYTAASTTSAPEWVAQGAGYFRQQGLDVALPFSSPASLTAGLISGGFDVGYGSPGSVAAADAHGADLVIFGATYEGSQFSIVARPDIKSVPDLKGKKVGATQRGATTDFLIRKVAQQQGLGPNDVTVVYIPDQATQIPALVSGALDAAVLTEPLTSLATAQGMHVIFGPDTKGADEFVSMSVVTTKKGYLAAHRDLLKRFLMANIQGVHLIKTNPDEAAKYIGSYMKMDDQAVLRQSLVSVKGVLRDDFSLTMPGLQSVIDNTAATDADVAKVKPQDITDLSLVDEIKASGFLNTLK
ncbi:MAG TPA: ABC transporter substrate-binding protein [Chloroflexota bacterium]|nr:ABC transporter substrate-binding protein [Chloroflexota bacterium]